MDVLLCAVALALGTTTPEVQKTLDDAEEHYTRAEFGKAISLLDDLIQKQKDLDMETRARVYFRVGANWTAIGNPQRADEAFRNVLDIDYDFALPTLVPRSLRATFEAAREAYVVRPTLSHEPPQEIDPREGVELEFSTSRRIPKSYEVQLFYRLQGAQTYRKLSLDPSAEVLAATIGAADLNAQHALSLEYYLEVLTPKQLKSSGLREAEDPYRVPFMVMEAPPKSVARSWWFWTIIGTVVVVAAAGVTAGVLLSQTSSPGLTNAHVVLEFP